MTDVLGIIAYLLLPAIGMVIWRVPFIRALPLSARLALSTAAGALIAALTMAGLSLVGIEWSRGVILTAALLFTGIGWRLTVDGWRWRRNSGPRQPSTVNRQPNRPALAVTATSVLLTLYGTLTARESCGDLVFTWGPKAIRWFRAGGIDPDVLRTWPQLTVDYPPLHTLLLAFSNTVAGQFPWWAAVLASPLFFLATLAVLRTFSGDEVGTGLVAATMAWTFAVAFPAGGAEPVLLLFEMIAIAALTFVDDPRTQTFLAALGAAGAVFTKLEGTTFAIAVVLTILLVQRNYKRALIVGAPAAALFAAWMGFVFWNDLLYMYGGARMPIYWSALPVTLKTLAKVAAFQSYGLPWIVPAVLIALGHPRRALVPLSIAVLTMGATVFFYIHYPDPVWWIESSSPRVLLTPLMAFLVAAVAAWRKPAI
jgi:hypothetical protein